MELKRMFTDRGDRMTDVFEYFQWKSLDVVINDDKTGKPIFEQYVEFPVDWSYEACKIVASKYFYGAMESPEREYSLKQLIARVVNKIIEYGHQYGYFQPEYDTKDDNAAHILEAELTFMLINQMFAWNSPVWFNIGTPNRQGVSACYITQVDDNLDSIIENVGNEMRIFADGSGNGFNASRMRGSKEAITGGGTSSGPISFMKVYDAGAGVVKSGGKTRRAAKMVIMNIDHPDIEEFITCKSKEENKARALIEAGFDGSFDGEATRSVFFQNANHSVRITNKFMDAVKSDDDWQLVNRVDGKTTTVKARYLWDLIAQEAWKTGDPGVQYHDIIQDWHTCKVDGEIEATNPCFVGDTFVLTENGLITIKDIVNNDFNGEETIVIDKDGEKSKLNQYLITGTNEIVKINTSDGREIRVTENHECLTANRGKVKAKNLIVGDELIIHNMNSEIIGNATIDIDPIDRKSGERALPILPEYWSIELAEILGHMIGDGYVSNDGIAVLIYGTVDKSENEDLFNKHLDWAERLIPSSPPNIAITNNGCKQIRWTRKAIGRFFEALGVSKARAQDKRVPKAIFTSGKNMIASFLRGYFGADGTVYGRLEAGECEVSASSASIFLLRDVQMLLGLFAIRSKISIMREASDEGIDGYATHACYRLRIHPEDQKTFANTIGFSVESKQAKLLNLIENRNANKVDNRNWECTVLSVENDGIETTFNVTEPKHNLIWANGLLMPQCAEYVFLNWTSCNLSSFNLLKFFDYSINQFMIEEFEHAIMLATISMNILIDLAEFPVDKIAEGTLTYRTIGIGYANIGGLLMAMGIPYDSSQARHMIGAITSLMTSTAYLASAHLAKLQRPFLAFNRNKESMLAVIQQHRSAHDKLLNTQIKVSNSHRILDCAANNWGLAYKMGKQYGYRNAQTTVIAPTGTISFMMDCDTTGIEPELGLEKIKSLVNGGSLRYVNKAVEPALKTLGYSSEEIKEAMNDLYCGRPIKFKNAEHRKVFACSFDDMSGNNRWDSIAPEVHVLALAAAAPFLSGSASKTCNLPESATVEDIKRLYELAYEHGVKCIAVYRNGCKTTQPMSTGKKKDDIITADMIDGSPFIGSHMQVNTIAPKDDGWIGDTTHPSWGQAHPDWKNHICTETISGANFIKIKREEMPRERTARVHEVQLNGNKGYFTMGEYEDGRLGEVFITMSRQGSFAHGLMDFAGIMISLALQWGIPLEDIVRKLKQTKFQPQGFTGNPEIPQCNSVLDYLGQLLEKRYIVGIREPRHKIEVPENFAIAGDYVVGVDPAKPNSDYTVFRMEYTGNPCPDCGAEMIYMGGRCAKCFNCGNGGECGG